MKNLLIVLFILLILVSLSVYSFDNREQGIEEVINLTVVNEQPINYGQRVLLNSRILASKIELNIYLPDSFEQSKHYQTFPVLFVNGSHGDQFFHQVTGVVRHLTNLDRMPDTIVVSLNYSGHFPKVLTNGMWSSREEINGYGDTNNYLRHLKTELFPYLANTYNANDYRQIIGVSASALFPLYVLTNEAGLFQDYMFLAASDMIGMSFTATPSNTIAEQIIKQINSSTLTTASQGTVYFVNADDDLVFDPAYQVNMAVLREGAKPLKNTSKRLLTDVIENERHYDALLKGLLTFFEQVYPEALWAPKYRELIKVPGDALKNIDDYYLMLSQKYGYKIFPNADRWNSVNCLRFIAGKLFQEEAYIEALTIANRWQFYLPDNVDAKLMTAKVQIAMGDSQLAKVTLDTALVKANKQHHWKREEIQSLLAKLASAIH